MDAKSSTRIGQVLSNPESNPDDKWVLSLDRSMMPSACPSSNVHLQQQQQEQQQQQFQSIMYRAGFLEKLLFDADVLMKKPRHLDSNSRDTARLPSTIPESIRTGEELVNINSIFS